MDKITLSSNEPQNKYAAQPVGFEGYPPPQPAGTRTFVETKETTTIIPPQQHQQPHQLQQQQPLNIVNPGVGPGWMNVPHSIPNCPPGLEYLAAIDQLLVHQKVELLEAFTGFETKNKFTVKNALGQKVYWAVEESGCCGRNMFGAIREFDMRVMDASPKQVLHLHRPLRCKSCCCPCCLQVMEVSTPNGNVLGSIEQEWALLYPSFSVKNSIGDVVLKIEGPLCTFSFCGDVEFKIVTTAGVEVGKISKQWSGLIREMYSDADMFGITFPMDLDVRMKAVMLGACFLIDAMYFESTGKKN